MSEATDYAAMSDEDVDFMLTGLLNPTWEFVRVGDEEYWQDPTGKSWGMEEYCSPDAPVSLRAEMVDAVRALGMEVFNEFLRCVFQAAESYGADFDEREGCAAGLLLPQIILARLVLAALEAAQGGER